MDRMAEIDRLIRQTRKREFEDGLIDLIYGPVFLLIGVAGWFTFSPAGLRWLATALIRWRGITTVALLAVPAAVVLLVLGLRALVERVRITSLWRGRGFVRTLRWQVRTSVTVVAVALSLALIGSSFGMMAAGLIDQEAVLRAVVAAVSVGTAVIYLGTGLDLEVPRYVGVGAAGLALAALVLVRSATFASSWLINGIGWMLILVVSGLIGLRTFRGSSPVTSSD